MRELEDSSAIADNAEELRHRIADQGYVFFRGLLDPAPIHRLATDLRTALQREGWLADGVAPEEAALQGPARDFKNANFFGGYTALQRLEYFHALPHEPVLTKVMANLIGSDVFIHPRKVGRIVWPTKMGTTPGIYTHQDYVVEGVPDMFTSWIPFVDCSRDLGGLAILTGSQNEGVVPRLHRVRTDDDAWATTDYRVGDVLIFHCLTAHAALPNETDGLRLSGDYRWQSTEQELPADALLPHMHGAVPGWAELTEGWASDEWVAPPAGVEVVERFGGEIATRPYTSQYVSVPPQTPHHGEHTVLAGIFNNMQDSFRPSKAAGERAVISYLITSDSGDHRWQLEVADGACQVIADGEKNPDVTITSDFRSYLGIISGKLDPAAALGAGNLRIDGDIHIALNQMQWFRD
jgi:ectoine hydroxylase-related dioxygenase (phytanoyl-CoA dioxygenase family)/putative sterol carrier protein